MTKTLKFAFAIILFYLFFLILIANNIDCGYTKLSYSGPPPYERGSPRVEFKPQRGSALILDGRPTTRHKKRMSSYTKNKNKYSIFLS
ncbi:hypothetical protein P8452_20534 [Trifolium repens]|nr:hypothetical protein P8452_20534 [Trifolium repens]